MRPRHCVLIVFSLSLAGCATHPARDPVSTRVHATYDLNQIRARLGLSRAPTDLGLSEVGFDSCELPVKGESEKCGPRYLSLLNFRLVCRDSEDTVNVVVKQTAPLQADPIDWQIGDRKGLTTTDGEGFGQILLVSPASLTGTRLALTIDYKSVGKEIPDIHPIVLPNHWCQPR